MFKFPLRQALTLIALAASLTGCAKAVPLAAVGQPGGMAALADFPSVDRLIAEATLEVNEFGTLVKALPRHSAPKATTFLTYKALDNNLGVTLHEHLNTLEKAGSNAELNVLAYTDDFGPKNTRRYYVRKDRSAQAVTSPYTQAGRWDLDTGKGDTLEKAVRWGFGQYPSRFRWLDVNAHGGGYVGIASDDRSKSMIGLPALAAAIGAGTRGQGVDVLSFDACLMATVEVAHEVKGVAKVMVASEDISYALGMNMDRTLAAFGEQAAPDARALARSLVLRAERKGELKALYTLSAIDLGRAAPLTASVDRLAGALLAAMPAHGEAIRRAVASTPSFYVAGMDNADNQHRDLAAFIGELKRRVPDAGVATAAAGVKAALYGRDGAVIMNLAAPEEGEVGGLSIHLPTGGAVDPRYAETAFAKDTRWDEFLAAL